MTELMRQAYIDCLLWSVTQDYITDRFTQDTGMSLPPQATNALDRMIDDATGIGKEFAAAYIAWFDRNIWGESDVPK